MRFLAYITKGLEPIVRHELRQKIPGADIERTSDKYLIFEADRKDVPAILELRTVDDVHILLKFHEHGQKPDEEQVVEEIPVAELDETRDFLESLRDTGEKFSLTVSRYRNPHGDPEKLESILTTRLEAALEMRKIGGRSSRFDIRVHVEEKNTIISSRLTEKPLYYRDYWDQGRKGSLKTSIAAALCRLTGPEPGDRLVDNFCGAGTILCEGKLQEMEPHGGDIDREAVKCAHRNMDNLSPETSKNIKQVDAISTGRPDSYFDIAVSNLPWGKQVELDTVKLYSRSIKEYSRILKDDACIALLCTEPELAVKHLKKNFPGHRTGRFQLGFLGQNPWVTYAVPESQSLNIV